MFVVARSLGDSAFKKIEVVGTFTDSVSDAIQSAVRKADQTLENLEWFEVDEIRGFIDDSDRIEYQVTLEIGFQFESFASCCPRNVPAWESG